MLTDLLAVVAAFAFGANWVLQQWEAAKAPDQLQLHPLQLLRLLLRRPLWLLGLSSLVVGSVVQQFALADGDLGVDEALLVLDLVFALVFADRVSPRSVQPLQWLGALTMCVGLGVFLVAANPSTTHGGGAIVRWSMLLGAAGAVCVALSVVGIVGTGRLRAVMFATASAVAFGVSDSFSAAAFSFTGDSIGSQFTIFAHWQAYALLATAIVGLGLGQVAFNAAPLAVSLPSLAVGEPVVGLIAGIGVLGVSIRTSPAAVVVEVLAAVAIIGGSVVVGRSRVLELEPETA